VKDSVKDCVCDYSVKDCVYDCSVKGSVKDCVYDCSAEDLLTTVLEGVHVGKAGHEKMVNMQVQFALAV
jgi:hypothetical protein